MPERFVGATEVRQGSYILIENTACVVKSVAISTTGKHGAAKVRIEAVGLLDERKRVIIKPGHERFGVPHIEKRRGTLLSLTNLTASLMDVESYETVSANVPAELKGQLSEGQTVEYWDVEGVKIVKRAV